MIIIKEDSTILYLSKLSCLYKKLSLSFSVVSKYFTQKAFLKENLTFTEVATDEELRRALKEIEQTLTTLDNTWKKFNFDKRSLEERYRDELTICQSEIKIIQSDLNIIWNNGQPGRNGDVPFGNTTSYRLIISCLLLYINKANNIADAINNKIQIFNRKNNDLTPLPLLSLFVKPPIWATKYGK